MKAGVSVTQLKGSVHCTWVPRAVTRGEECGRAVDVPPSRSRIMTLGLICPQEAAVPNGKGPVWGLDRLGPKA